MKTLAILTLTAVLTLLSSIAHAETPDECAARLDQSIAVTTYAAAAEWWSRVERECAPQPDTAGTPEPTEIPDYQGLYGWEGDFVFCVMAPTLNIRNRPAGTVINRFDKGDYFTIDLASQTLVEGFVWGRHDKGWSALFRYPGYTRIDEFTYPRECPKPTPVPTAARVRTTTAGQRATHEIIRTGATKTFTLSGADCAITASRGTPIESGKLYLAAGRLGWLRDLFMVDIFSPGNRTPLTYHENEVQGESVGLYSHQLYLPENIGEAFGYYTIEVKTHTESKKYSLNVTSKSTYNIAVACE